MMKKTILVLGLLGLIGFLALILVPAVSLQNNRAFTPVTIPSGDYSLQGYLSKGSDPDGPIVIFFHGNRADGLAHPLYQQILQMFPQGMTILGVDKLGYGRSKVDPSIDPAKVIDYEETWRAAVKYIEESQGARPDQIILVGHSLGAAIVMDAARKETFLLAIPIGLGDWQTVLDDPLRILSAANRISAFTGVPIPAEAIKEHGKKYTREILFGSCPQTPIRLVFARSEEARENIFPYVKKAQKNCDSLVEMRTVPLGDHTYGTELTFFPKPLREVYSRAAMTLLKWQLLQLVRQPGSTQH